MRLFGLRCTCLALWVGTLLLSPALWANTIETMRFKRLLHGQTDTDEVINAVHVTRQDPHGFIWFGGEHGLARYDGHDVKIYQHRAGDPDSLTSNAIWDIVFDHNGVMWLATDSGLGRYNAASDTFTSFRSKGFDTNSITGDSVRTLAVDKDNNLLIGTDNGFNILDPSRKHYRTYTDRENDPFRLPNATIRAIYTEHDGHIWLGTTSAGLLRLTLKPFAIKRYSHDPNDPTSIGHNRITDILRDHTGALWVSSFGGGISRMNADGKGFTNYHYDPDDPTSLGSNTVWNLFEDSLNNLWIATDHGGLALFNRDSNNFNHLRHNPYDNTSLSSDNIRSIFEDRQGDLWIGAFPIGTNFFDRSSTVFENHTHVPGQQTSLSHSTILTIEKSQAGHLWIGTEGGINAFDPVTKKSTSIQAQPGVDGALQSNAILAIAERDNGELWVGTWSGGLYRRQPNSDYFQQFMPPTNKGTMASNGSEPARSTTSDLPRGQYSHTVNSAYIWNLLVDQNERYLWIGTETGGLNRYDFETEQFRHYEASEPPLPNHVSNPHVWSLMQDSEGVLWAGSLHGLNRYDAQTDTFSHFFNSTGNKNTLGNNRVIALFEDDRQNLWIGTQGGGISILDANRESFSHIGVDDGLPSANVASIIQTQDGKIWATTDKGVASITAQDPQFSRYSIKKYQKSHGLIGNNFNRDASYVDASGRLFLGSTDGLSIFDSDNVETRPRAPDVVFTDFRIFNESVNTATPNSPLNNTIQNTETIHLGYEQRFFSIGFSALSYRSANRNQYAYKLEGFDKDWNNVGNRHVASYTNIGPGRYTLHVKAANAAGVWNETGRQLTIIVSPPIWRSWWAYGIYTLLALALMWAYSRHKAKRIELQKERDVNAKLVKLDKMKDSFLANTSHELRTPLNGIIGLAEALRDSCSGALDSGKLGQLSMIVSSGRRLSHLINDILDLSKLADRKIELKREPVDLRYLTDTVITLLSPLVNDKPISLQNDIPEQFYAVLADENRLQQIMFNLIGNAIKYSDRGFVKINAQQDSSTTTIRVKDTGVGIAPEDLETIFQSFCQLEHSDAREHGGTGLGLAITKQLVELHGGAISVLSQPGKGTTFIFTMPTSQHLCERKNLSAPPVNIEQHRFKAKGLSYRKAATLDDTSEEQALKIEPPTNRAPREATEHSDGGSRAASKAVSRQTHTSTLKIQPLNNAGSITVLSVDDDPVNRIVLNGILKLHHYKVLEATDGQSAIDKINQHPEIDLVIMDVMMPKMTGYEACEILRKQYPMHELPIIFLTAKDIETELTQGFLSGGNDFVSKPIKKEELLARVKAQLTLALQARGKGAQLNPETPCSQQSR
ncbi:MAG TPA: two-component regulator propeller domain-containing protein [Marinagarivorans sp.]